MSVDLARTASNETSSSSLSQLINHDYPDSDGDSSSAPYVVSKHRSSAVAGPSKSATTGQNHHHRRASSVVSLSSSSLTDPDDLELVTSSFADTSARAKGNASNTSLAPSTEPESEEEEEDDEDDGLIEVNQDGTEKPLARIQKLLSNPPNEPKHSWETAYVYAFIERFTNIQKDSAYAPQTIFEFELALEEGDVPTMPGDLDDIWLPSLEPIFKDFVERIRNQDKANGGTGGTKGGWQAWIPWWISEQRQMQVPDFMRSGWLDTIRKLRDREQKNAIYKIDWEKKVTILKAMVDFQICLCEEVKTYINDCYGYVSSYRPQARTQEEKEARAKEKAEARAESAAVVAAAVAAVTGKPKLEVTGKDKGKEKEKEKPVEVTNPLVLRPIGSDTLKQVWYRIDDSPRLYVNGDPYGKNSSFVAVSDTPKEIHQILTGLQVPPKQSAKLSGPFAKAADGKKLKKQKKKKGRALLIENEEKLHEYIRDIVLPSLESAESPYFERKTRFENRRSNMIKKVQKEARMEALAAQRAVDAGYGSLRSSTRLRRGARITNGYDESARDYEIEAAIRESERAARKRRRTGSESSDGEYDDERDSKNDHHDGESDGDDFDEDDSEDGNSRRSRRARARNNGGSSISRAAIPGERRSARQHLQAQYREPTPEFVQTGRKASIVRSNPPDMTLELDGEDEEEAPFGGLEEVWTMGRYRGYYRPDRTFIKAQKGDIPLYKLAKMGLPLPPLSGPIPGASSSSNSASSNGASSTAQTVADRIAAIDGEVPRSRASTSNSASAAANQSMDVDGDVSMPGSAVPTLLNETDDRETDDSNVLLEESMNGDDEDEEDSDAPVVVSSSSKAKASAIKTNGNGSSSSTAKSPSAVQQNLTKMSPRDTSHVQVIV